MMHPPRGVGAWICLVLVSLPPSVTFAAPAPARVVEVTREQAAGLGKVFSLAVEPQRHRPGVLRVVLSGPAGEGVRVSVRRDLFVERPNLPTDSGASYRLAVKHFLDPGSLRRSGRW